MLRRSNGWTSGLSEVLVLVNGGSIRVNIHHNYMEDRKTYKQMKLWSELHDKIKMQAAENGLTINQYLEALINLTKERKERE